MVRTKSYQPCKLGDSPTVALGAKKTESRDGHFRLTIAGREFLTARVLADELRCGLHRIYRAASRVHPALGRISLPVKRMAMDASGCCRPLLYFDLDDAVKIAAWDSRYTGPASCTDWLTVPQVAERLNRKKGTVYGWLKGCPHLNGRPLDWTVRILKAGNTMRRVTLLNPDEIEMIRKRLAGNIEVSDGHFRFVKKKQFVFQDNEGHWGSWGFVIGRYQLHQSTLRNWGDRGLVRCIWVNVPGEIKARHKMQRVYHLDDLNRKVSTGEPTHQPPIREVHIDDKGEVWLPNYLATSWYRLPLKPHTLRDQGRVRAKRIHFDTAKGQWSPMRWVFSETDLQRESREPLCNASKAERAQILEESQRIKAPSTGDQADGARSRGNRGKRRGPYESRRNREADARIYEDWLAARKKNSTLTTAQHAANTVQDRKNVENAINSEKVRRLRLKNRERKEWIENSAP